MKTKKSKLIAFLSLFVFLLLQIQVSSTNPNEEVKLSMSGIKAVAQTDPVEDRCTSFGYRDWDHPLSFKDGYDCLCEPKEKVKNDC